MPAVARQQRHRVEHDEPLDPLGVALREGERGRAPVVHDEPHALDLHDLVEEALDEARDPLERVVVLAALAGAAEAEQVGREAAGALRNGSQSSLLVGTPWT